MNTQTITTASGERLVVLSEADYDRLVAAAEDNADRGTVAEFRRQMGTGEEELIPAEIVDRLLSGENRVRVWREHRGLTSTALATRAQIGQGFLSQIETGGRDGTVETLRKLAEALGVTLDDLAAPASLAPPVPGLTQCKQLEELIRRKPGLTETELAAEMFGPGTPQQRVNAKCRRLFERRRVERRGHHPFRYYAIED